MDDLVIVEDPRVDVVLVEADSLTTVESTDIQVVDVGVGGGGGASIDTGNGLIAKVGLGSSFAARTLASLAAALSITNADGVAGNPTFNLVGTQLADYGITDAYTKTDADARYSPLAGSTSLVTVGTIVTGVWNAGAITSSDAIQAGTTLGISTDVFITREASNTVALRNGVTSQGFYVYNTYTDPSNYERAIFDWRTAVNALNIQTQAAGTGTLRNIYIQAGGGLTSIGSNFISSKLLSVQGSIAFMSSINIRGFVGPPVWDTSYFGFQHGALAETAANNAFNQSSLGDTILNAATGRTLFFRIGNGSGWQLNSSTAHFFASNDNAQDIGASAGNRPRTVYIGTSVQLGGDVNLLRDATNVLAMRNSATAQTFRVYNKFTDASNYERGVLDWSTTANTLTIGAQAAGTGTLRGVNLVGAGVTIASADNNNTTLPLLVTNSAGATIITTTGLGRVYIGNNSGSNVLLSVDVTGGALTGVIPLRVADSSGVLTIGSGGFGTSNTQIVFGANAFGNAIECVNPAGNGVFRMNGSNTTLGQTSLGGTPDKTLRVFNGVATTGVTSFRVRAGAGQSTNELAGVYANDDTTPYFRIVNGNTIVAGGLQLKTKAGALVDGDFTSPADGFIAIDTTNSKLYARIGGAWKSVTLT
jgi:hypothetical protein